MGMVEDLVGLGELGVRSGMVLGPGDGSSATSFSSPSLSSSFFLAFWYFLLVDTPLLHLLFFLF